MKYYNLLFLYLTVTMLPFFLQAQETKPFQGKIKGVVLDKESLQPVEYATIALFPSKDSTMVGGVVTDEKGVFELSASKAGNYTIRISFIGYKNIEKENIALNATSPLVDMGTIELESTAKVMQSIQIEAERSMMEYKLDKRVINVDKNIVTSGGTATDVLENVPSITVDNDGNISLRGSTNVKILIDGKPSDLYGSDIQQILEQIPANTIETIEVITNPSAKYDPEGMSGIINIKLKEKTGQGLNGTVNANFGSAFSKFLPTTSGSLSLNYTTGKLTLFGTLDANYRNNTSTGTRDFRKYINDSLVASGYQDQDYKRNNISGGIKLGAEYKFNRYNNLMLTYSYRLSDRNAEDEIRNEDRILSLNSYTENGTSNSDEHNHNIGLSYTKTFSESKGSLMMDASLGISDNKNKETSDQYYNNPSRNPILRQNETNGNDNNGYVNIAYDHPFSDKAKLEIGMNTTLNLTKRDNDYFFSDAAGNNTVDSLNTNNFTYNENVNAIFTTFSYQFSKKLSAQAGLRGEYVNTIGTQPELQGGDFTQNYFSLYPTLHLSYSFSERQSAQLSYSRRVKRPNMWQLNPFKNYSNPDAIEFGNPKLDPEYTNSFELGYSRYFKSTTLFGSAYFRETGNMISRYQFLWTEENAEKYGFVWDGDTTNRTAQTYMNVAQGINYGLEAIIDQTITKWWRINLSINLYQSVVDGSNLDTKDQTSFVANCKLNSYMTLPWQVVLQISGQYRSPITTVQGKMDDMLFFDLALKKDVLQKQGTINFRINDMFGTRKFGIEVDTPELQSYGTHKRISPTFSIGFSYKINQGNGKPRERQRQIQESSGGDEGIEN